MPLRPISKPVERITVSVRSDVTLESLQHLLDSIGAKSRRSVRHLFGRMEAPGGYNFVNMDVFPSKVVPQRGFRSIHVSLDVGWSPGSKDESRAVKLNRMDEINSLLGALRRIELNEETKCIASFIFESGETNPIISLPFPIASAVGFENAVVQGVRIAGFEDPSTSVMIDRQPGGKQSVSIGFTSQILFGQQVTSRVVALASPLLESLVKPITNIQLDVS